MGKGALGLSDSFSQSQTGLENFERFQSQFSVVKAYTLSADNIVVKTPALEEAAYRVRYKAYCQEHQFEQGMACGLERDLYDDFSAMALVKHVPSQIYVGTVRLIPQGRFGSFLPLLNACTQQLPIDKAAPNKYAEISRLCVSYRRLDDAHLNGDEASLILPFLLAASIEMSHDIHATHWLGAMRPSLLRKLSRAYGVELDWLGENMEYHGARIPFVSAVQTIESSIKAKRSILNDIISTEIGRADQDASYPAGSYRPFHR